MDSTERQPREPLLAATLPQHYCDPHFFDHERVGLFSRLWGYVGVKLDVAMPDDYFLVDFAGRNLIVQNCGGALKAFVNSCSHRHSRIHVSPSGNRKLVCPYHGWVYNNDGVPVGIRNASSFPEVLANSRCYALEQLELDCAGQFIFVRAQAGGPSLREFLGHAWDFLIRVSSGLDREVDRVQVSYAANWKVAIENTLEGYHLPTVHRSTWASLPHYSSKEEEDLIEHLPESNGHSSLIHKVSDEFLDRWKRYEPEIGMWPYKFDHYVHQFVFPNTTVTSRMGYSFHINRFHPDSLEQTTIDSRGYGVRFEGQTTHGIEYMNSVHELARRFNRKSWDEDKRVCELAQLGIRQAEQAAVLANDLEKRIAHFQRFYLQALETGRAPRSLPKSPVFLKC